MSIGHYPMQQERSMTTTFSSILVEHLLRNNNEENGKDTIVTYCRSSSVPKLGFRYRARASASMLIPNFYIVIDLNPSVGAVSWYIYAGSELFYGVLYTGVLSFPCINIAQCCGQKRSTPLRRVREKPNQNTKMNLSSCKTVIAAKSLQ